MINKLKDNQLIWRVKRKSCDESLLELTRRHSKLYYKICHKYFPFKTGAFNKKVEDLLGHKDGVIYEAVDSYKPSKKVKFSTWLGNFVRYRCLNYLNKNSRFVDVESDTLDFLTNAKSEELFNKDKDNETVDFVLNLISQFTDKRIKKIFQLRYFAKSDQKMTWIRIGKELDISAQTAINLHNKGKDIIRKKMSCARFADKII